MNAAALYGRALAEVTTRGPAPLGHCTRDTLRCADARSYTADLRECCRGHLRQVVSATMAALASAGVPFWADYGTLLGAVRNPLTTWADYPWLSQENRPTGPLEPGIIPHDKDADFGVFWSDWTKLMRVRIALERQGYTVIARAHVGAMKVCLSPVNRTNLDLFAWVDHPGGILRRVHYIGVDQYKGRDFPRAWLEPMETVEWEGMVLPAPQNPARVCAYRYGETWRTPIAANHDGQRRP